MSEVKLECKFCNTAYDLEHGSICPECDKSQKETLFNIGDLVAPVGNAVEEIKSIEDLQKASLQEIDKALNMIPLTVKEIVRYDLVNGSTRFTLYGFEGLDTFCLYEFELEEVS